MAEDNNTGIGYVPFQSNEPGNALANDANPLHGTKGSDYTQVFQDMINTPLPDIQVPEITKGGGNYNLTAPGQAGYDPFSANPVRYAKKSDVERYMYQDDFQGEGFNPFDSHNYDRWVAKETWSSALSKGLDSFSDKFGHTFKDYWKDYGRMVSALAHADSIKLLPSEMEMLEQNYAEHISSMKNYVFVPEEEEDAIFSKRSISEFVGNAGFALGTFAGITTELVADALITLATAGGGAASFGATAGRLTTKLGTFLGRKAAQEVGEKVGKEGVKQAAKKGNLFTGLLLADESLDVIKQTDNLKKVNQLNKNRTITRDMKKGFTEIFGINLRAAMNSEGWMNKAWELSKGIPLAGTTLKYGEKTVAAAKAGRGFGETAGIALKGMRRVGMEYNLAGTEAAFEAVSTYGATLEQMIQQHVAETGQEVDPATFETMKQMAGNAAFANYGTNLAILLASNQIQFGTLFSKMTPSNKFIQDLIEEGAEQQIRVSRRAALKGAAKEVIYDTSGFMGMYGNVFKIAKDFGKKQALYEVGRHFGKGLLRFEVTEGIQENLQEMSNHAWQQYYAGRVNGVYKTLDKAFEEGAAEQFTKQGFKTFLQGALTGSFIRLPVHIGQYAGSKASEYAVGKAYEGQGKANPFEQAKKTRLDNIKLFNEFAKHAADQSVEHGLNFSAQANEAMKATEAATDKKDYEFVNARDNAMIKAAFAANSLNMIDAYKSVLQDMGMNMTEAEFETAFKTKLSDTKYNSVAEFTQSVSNRVENYSNKLDEVRKRVKNDLINPFEYEADSDDQVVASATRKAQEEAIQLIALNELKANRADERAEKVFQEYNSIKDLANSSDYVYRVLSNGENLFSEIANLDADLKVINDAIKAGGLAKEEKKELLKQKLEKENERKLLTEWSNYWENREVIIGGQTEGEEGQLGYVVPDTFMGKNMGKVKVNDDNGNPVEQDNWDPTHSEVQDLFIKILNLKNQQQGIDTKVSRASVTAGWKNVVDFMQLERDARDYMESVEALNSPESFMEIFRRMRDGKYKFFLLDFVDSIEHRIEQTIQQIFLDEGLMKPVPMRDGTSLLSFEKGLTKEKYEATVAAIKDAVVNSESFENLIRVLSDKTLGIEQANYIQEQIQATEEFLKKALKEELQEYIPDYRFDEVISDGVWDKYTKIKEAREKGEKVEEELDEGVLESIAQRLADTGNASSLSPREKEIYEAYEATIEVKRKAILEEKEKAEKLAGEREGKAYAELDSDTKTYKVFDEKGELLKEGLTITEADELVNNINKANSEQDAADQLKDQIDAINEEYNLAIKSIRKRTSSEMRGDDTTEEWYESTFLIPGDTSRMRVESPTWDSLKGKLDKIREQAIEMAKRGVDPETINTSALGSDPTNFTIPEAEEFEDEDLSMPDNKKMEIINQIKVLNQMEKEGKTETGDGSNIAELKEKLLNQLNALEQEERGSMDYGEDVSRRRNNAFNAIKTGEDGIITTEWEDREGTFHTFMEESEEAVRLKVTEASKFELDMVVKPNKKTIELVEEDLGKTVTVLDTEGNVKQGVLSEATEDYGIPGLKYIITSDMGIGPVQDGSIVMFDDSVSETEDTEETVEGKGIESSSTIKPGEETGEEGETKFPVRDPQGGVMHYVNSKEEADRLMAEMENSYSNWKWTESFLKGRRKKSKNLPEITYLHVSQLKDKLDTVLEKINKKLKKKKFNTIQEAYNAGKTYRKMINKAIEDFDGKIDDVELNDTKEQPPVTPVSKNPTDISDVVNETNSEQFSDEVFNLYTELQDIELPTTTDKTGQFGIIFPEGTTDFTNFVNASAEQVALDQLLKIKPACKK